MYDAMIKRYTKLNELAKKKGIVLMGDGEDWNIPLHELTMAFSLDYKVYNRSFRDLSVRDAIAWYDLVAADLFPEIMLLHIGSTDLMWAAKDGTEFTTMYQELIQHIKSENEFCRIVVVSLKNYENDPEIAHVNQMLKYIAQSEHCEYEDISTKRLWNPKETKEVISFMREIGFVRPLKVKQSIYDLVKIIFCCED